MLQGTSVMIGKTTSVSFGSELDDAGEAEVVLDDEIVAAGDSTDNANANKRWLASGASEDADEERAERLARMEAIRNGTYFDEDKFRRRKEFDMQ